MSVEFCFYSAVVKCNEIIGSCLYNFKWLKIFDWNLPVFLIWTKYNSGPTWEGAMLILHLFLVQNVNFYLLHWTYIFQFQLSSIHFYLQIDINFLIRSHNVIAGQLLKLQLNSICCCRLAFETALKHRGGPSIVFAHSLGNNVFRYFLEWLKLEIAPKAYIHWLDEHIHAYFAVGIYLSKSESTFLTELIRAVKHTIYLEFVLLIWFQDHHFLVQFRW